MTETSDITYDELLHQERLRLLNAGCFNVSNLTARYGAINYDEQVTSAEFTDGVLTIQVGSRTLTIDDVLSFGDYAVHPYRTDKTAFTVYAAGPRGGPSPAISFAPRGDLASQALIDQSKRRMNACYQADQRRERAAREQELIDVLQTAFVGRVPAKVELYKSSNEQGFRLIYGDGSAVTVALNQVDYDEVNLEFNGVNISPYFY